MNPFHGYPEEDRNILDPNLRETIREFSAIDGAFVIRDDGVVMAAGRHLNAALEEGELPRGLGSRHVAGAGITAVTDAWPLPSRNRTGRYGFSSRVPSLWKSKRPHARRASSPVARRVGWRAVSGGLGYDE